MHIVTTFQNFIDEFKKKLYCNYNNIQKKMVFYNVVNDLFIILLKPIRALFKEPQFLT